MSLECEVGLLAAELPDLDGLVEWSSRERVVVFRVHADLHHVVRVAWKKYHFFSEKIFKSQIFSRRSTFS